MLRVATALALSRCASAFVTPVSHVAPVKHTAMRAVPETLSALQHTLPTSLTAFANQGGNLAGKFPGAGHEVRLRDNFGNETARERFGCREDAARIAPFQRLGDTDEARQEPARRSFRTS